MNRMMLLVFAATALAIPSHAADGLRDKLIPYKTIEIAQTKNKVGDNLDEAVIHDLQARVVAAITESKLLAATFNSALSFPPRDASDDSKLSFQGTGDDADSKSLILFNEIITFNKGNRAKRYFASGGSGRAELRGNCYLIDKKTGQQLFNFQTFGETNWGLLGGGSDKTLKGYTSRIVGFLKGKY